MSIEDVKSAVAGLSAGEFARFCPWFEEFMADQWDHQIEQDALSGRLDDAIQRADDHYVAGRCTRLESLG